jgi:hypothetical protein
MTDTPGAKPSPSRSLVDELGGAEAAQAALEYRHRIAVESWRPRARDVPHWRDELARAWSPAGSFTALAPILAEASNGRQRLIPVWEHDTVSSAALWFVGADMAELLDGAAPQLPDTALTREVVPDMAGLVIFERPLAGIDAEGAGVGDVQVGAMLWGPARWDRDGSAILGVTVYGCMPARSPFMQPLGGLIWPLGRTMDDSLSDDNWGGDFLTDIAVASMAEDRRRLMALWLLSTQPGLASSIAKVQDRASARYAQRTGRDATVRVVNLRGGPPATEGTERAEGWHYHHRFVVAGHWRNQAFGPAYSQHRPVYINPHLKGDGPLLTSPKVKSWTR